MNSFNIKAIIADDKEIHRYGGIIDLQAFIFHHKSNGTGWWIPVAKIDDNSWHGVSVNHSNNSPLGYMIEYSKLTKRENVYELCKDNCNISAMTLSSHYKEKRQEFIDLVYQILHKDKEFEALNKWIARLIKYKG